jgi:hypothetical protein
MGRHTQWHAWLYDNFPRHMFHRDLWNYTTKYYLSLFLLSMKRTSWQPNKVSFKVSGAVDKYCILPCNEFPSVWNTSLRLYHSHSYCTVSYLWTEGKQRPTRAFQLWTISQGTLLVPNLLLKTGTLRDLVRYVHGLMFRPHEGRFRFFLSLSRKMLGEYIWLGHNFFLLCHWPRVVLMLDAARRVLVTFICQRKPMWRHSGIFCYECCEI